METHTIEQYNFWKKRELSWSQISQFQYNQEVWYNKYLLGKKTPTNAAMEFGSIVGRRLASEPDYLPLVPRGTEYEKELRCEIGGIPCIGFIDSFDMGKKLMCEYKTGKSWDKDRADLHGQLRMYALMLMIQDKIKPEDLTIKLVSLETTESGDFTMQFVKGMKPVIHEVKLTTKDCLLFGAELLKIVKEMETYALAYKVKE